MWIPNWHLLKTHISLVDVTWAEMHITIFTFSCSFCDQFLQAYWCYSLLIDVIQESHYLLFATTQRLDRSDNMHGMIQWKIRYSATSRVAILDVAIFESLVEPWGTWWMWIAHSCANCYIPVMNTMHIWQPILLQIWRGLIQLFRVLFIHNTL